MVETDVSGGCIAGILPSITLGICPKGLPSYIASDIGRREPPALRDNGVMKTLRRTAYKRGRYSLLFERTRILDLQERQAFGCVVWMKHKHLIASQLDLDRQPEANSIMIHATT